ncbi:MAG: hypothetical protein NC121_12790 [Blautia sp.]|nr:hypothetical protein [Blautia sp.]
MLQVTARVFDNNQLVGYQITDGSQTQLFTRQQAWLFAKNRQLINVVATGDAANPGLSGTNGFELKRLPEIKWKEPQSVKTSQKLNFTTQDMAAAVIRNAINNDVYHLDNKEMVKEVLKTDVSNGVISAQNCRTLSSSILVENTLYDSTVRGGSIAVGHQLTEDDRKEIKKIAPLYSRLRLIADIMKDIMNLNNANVLTLDDLRSFLGNPEAANKLGSVMAFKQQGGNAKTLAKGVNELVKLVNENNPAAGTTGTITRDMLDELDDLLDGMKADANPQGLMVTQAIIGYRIRNISSQVIPIVRMTATPDHSTSQAALNPGQSMCLNRAEMALLAGRPEIGCTFANGKLVCGSRKRATSLYDYLVGYYFLFERMQVNAGDANRYRLSNPGVMDGVNVNNPNIKVDVRKLESPDIVDTYFTPASPAQATQQKASQAQQAQKGIQQKGLFNGFKR